jgi:hypothetical protein
MSRVEGSKRCEGTHIPVEVTTWPASQLGPVEGLL